MSKNTKVKGERISFTIDKNTFEQFDKILYMQRRGVKDILIPLIKGFVENNKEDIKRYDKIFNKESTPKVEESLTQAQKDKALEIICNFIKENETHFHVKGDTAAPVEKPEYGIKKEKYIAVEKEPLRPLLLVANLDPTIIFREFAIQLEYRGRKSYRMVKIEYADFEKYCNKEVLVEINGADQSEETLQ